MSDRETWLQLTQEDALEPEMAICDPHHHFWEHPGSRYLLEEFQSDISGGHRIKSTVFVECRQKYHDAGPDAIKPVGETEFVDQLVQDLPPDEPAIAAAIVGFADLSLGAEVRAVLEAHQQASQRFRGIRHASAWHASDKIHNAHTSPPEGLLMSRDFRQGFAVLAEMDLSFDAWLYHTQLDELTDLAHAFPGARIILDHMAGPLGIGPYQENREQAFKDWRSALAPLAACENVSVKLGGRAMTMAGFGWHKNAVPPGSIELAEAMAPYFHACIDLFSPNRCMFESNFPVDKASCSYTVLWNAFKRLSRQYQPAERGALFCDTANKVYRLSTRAC